MGVWTVGMDRVWKAVVLLWLLNVKDHRTYLYGTARHEFLISLDCLTLAEDIIRAL